MATSISALKGALTVTSKPRLLKASPGWACDADVMPMQRPQSMHLPGSCTSPLG